MANWFLYSYDALGLGHVRRMLKIAEAVLPERSDLSALLVTCSPQVDALPMPAGLDYLKLPSARKLSATQYASRSLRLPPDRLRLLRQSVIADTLSVFEPDLVLIDKSPCGLMGELRPGLERLRREQPHARCVLGWRDILDAPERVRAEWAARGTLQSIERSYDEVWVYGDAALFDVREEYDLPPALAERVRFLGYLSPVVEPIVARRAREQWASSGAPLAVVTAGGGEDGEALLSTWLEAERAGHLPGELESLVVTGPLMAPESRRRLESMVRGRSRVVSYVHELEALMAGADLVVGMAGYNTVVETVGAGTPAVFVPRSSQRDEQRLRARRLAERGLVECVEPEALSPFTLAEAAGRALDRGRREHRPAGFDGQRRAACAVDEALPRPGASPPRTRDLAPRRRTG